MVGLQSRCCLSWCRGRLDSGVHAKHAAPCVVQMLLALLVVASLENVCSWRTPSCCLCRHVVRGPIESVPLQSRKVRQRELDARRMRAGSETTPHPVPAVTARPPVTMIIFAVLQCLPFHVHWVELLLHGATRHGSGLTALVPFCMLCCAVHVSNCRPQG